MIQNRTVHARYPGAEIVRYDRAGKWWVEYKEGKRERLSVAEAAFHARWGLRWGGEVFFGRSGGQAFDRKVRGGS